jgi:hypothetical protein
MKFLKQFVYFLSTINPLLSAFGRFGTTKFNLKHKILFKGVPLVGNAVFMVFEGKYLGNYTF